MERTAKTDKMTKNLPLKMCLKTLNPRYVMICNSQKIDKINS